MKGEAVKQKVAVIAKQLRGKHGPAATNKHATERQSRESESVEWFQKTWDSKILSWAPRDLELEMAVLTTDNSSLPYQPTDSPDNMYSYIMRILYRISDRHH
jgi:hypothetical protein